MSFIPPFTPVSFDTDKSHSTLQQQFGTGCQTTTQNDITVDEDSHNAGSDQLAFPVLSWPQIQDPSPNIGSQQLFHSFMSDTKSFSQPVPLYQQPIDNVNYQPTQTVDYQPNHALTSASSFASLHSLASTEYSSDSFQGPASLANGDAVSFTPADLSRQSSCGSLNHSFYSSNICDPLVANQTVNPAMISSHKPYPQAQSNEIHYDRTHQRNRSLSRPSPYPLHGRSESTSSSIQYNHDGTQPSGTNLPWNPNWTGTSALTSSVSKMTLHHRRTSSRASNYSQLKHTPSKAKLVRGVRSSSLSFLKLESRDPSHSPPRARTEEDVRRTLEELSREVNLAVGNTQRDKARGKWVREWLYLNYSVQEGVSAARQGMYHSYGQWCNDLNVEAVNPASFGKAVRAAFPLIKTRRLGARGNSKYHFINLRPILDSEAKRLNEYGDSSGRFHVGLEDREEQSNDEMEDSDDGFDEDDLCEMDLPAAGLGGLSRPDFPRRHTVSGVAAIDTDLHLPVLDLPSSEQFMQACAPQDGAMARQFWEHLCNHLQNCLGLTTRLKLDAFERLYFQFWAQLETPCMRLLENTGSSQLVIEAIVHYFDTAMDQLMSLLPCGLSSKTTEALYRLVGVFELQSDQVFAKYSLGIQDGMRWVNARAVQLFRAVRDLNQASLDLANQQFLSTPTAINHLLSSWDCLDRQAIIGQCEFCSLGSKETIGRILDGFRSVLVEVKDSREPEGTVLGKLGEWIEVWLETLADDQVKATRLAIRTTFLTSQVMKVFTLTGDSCFRPYMLLKTWIDTFVTAWVIRRDGWARDEPEPYSGLRVSVPSGPLDFDGDAPTAVPLKHTRFSTGLTPFIFDKPSHLNLPQFDTPLATTPRGPTSNRPFQFQS